MSQCRTNQVAAYKPATISINFSKGAFSSGPAERCNSGLYCPQLDLELPARDKAPTVKAFLAYLLGKQWGGCLRTGLVCFRGPSQLDCDDPATVLVGGVVDLRSVEEAEKHAYAYGGGVAQEAATHVVQTMQMVVTLVVVRRKGWLCSIINSSSKVRGSQ